MVTAFKGYRLPTSCKKHTGTGSSSPKRVRCSGVLRSSSLPLQACSLYIHTYTLYTHTHTLYFTLQIQKYSHFTIIISICRNMKLSSQLFSVNNWLSGFTEVKIHQLSKTLAELLIFHRPSGPSQMHIISPKTFKDCTNAVLCMLLTQNL